MSFFEESSNKTLQESFIGCLICTIYLDGEATDEEIEFMVQGYHGRSIFTGFDTQSALRRQIMRRATDDSESILKECCAGITEEWKPTVFATCCDLVFKDNVITNEERLFLKRVKDYLQIPDDTANKILDVMMILYKGKI